MQASTPAPNTSSAVSKNFEQDHLVLWYFIPEVIVAVCAFAGNLVVVLSFIRDKRLRKLTNYYVVSLAVSDLLVGCLGIPCAILASMGLPYDSDACMITLTMLIMLCTISIFNLIAVSVDRYWAILYPLQYSSCMTGKTAIGMIVFCWVLGILTGLIPFMGWRQPWLHKCYFVIVMDRYYLVFLYFATIVAPSVIMAFFYARIYIVVIKQLRQISEMSHRNQASNRATVHMLANKKEVNAAKILFIIVSFFVLCWFPLYTMNAVQAFCPACDVPLLVINTNIILSHLNSAVNPILYAYHLRDFREAFKNLLLPRSLLGPPPSNTGVVPATGVATAAIWSVLNPSPNNGQDKARRLSHTPLQHTPEVVPQIQILITTHV